MGIWRWGVILAILLVLGAGAFQLTRTNTDLRGRVENLSEKLDKLEGENQYLTGQIDYLQNPENLLKEVRAHFNYRRPGEELIIIVPSATSTRP